MMGVILKNSTNMEEGINLSNDIREAFLAEDLLGLLFFFFHKRGYHIADNWVPER